MSSPILTTKFFIPTVKPQLVTRTRLHKPLTESHKHKLTLISAPPGFGKTTLLAEWLSTNKLRAAWLSLDDDDNDVLRFFSYLITAIQQVELSIGTASLTLLNETQQPSIESIVGNLVNELATLKHPCWIILDDYHVITNTDVQTAMFFLLTHLPDTIHLIISTRSDPPWKLGKLRSSQEMLELRASDLRFSMEETTQFLNQMMKLQLTEDDIAALETRTEGWIASLQMAALSMQKVDDVHAFVAAFTGSDRVIFDYLIEEVLHAQSPNVESFLLKTSVLELFDAEMCDFVLKRTDSHSILTNLEKSNLFLIPMDNEHRWFRYHHLFSDLLRFHLQHDDPLGALNIHKHTAEWLEQHGDPLGALQHFLSAKDLTNAIRVAEQNALSLLDHGQISDVNSWLNTIPQSMIIHSPWLSVARAWALIYLGKTDATETLLQQAEKHLAQLTINAESERIKGHITSIRAYAQWMVGNSALSVELCQVALDALPESDCLARSQVYVILGLSQQNLLIFDAAEKSFLQADECSRHLANSHIHLLAIANLGFLYYVQGKFSRAEQQCINLLNEFKLPDGNFRHLALANPLATLSIVYCSTGRSEQAIQAGENAVRLARQWQQMDTLHYALTCLDSAYLCAGEFEKADEMLAQAKKIAQDISPWWQRISERQEVIHYFFRNQPEAVSTWLENKGFNSETMDIQTYFEYFQTYVRALMLQGKYELALQYSIKLMETIENEEPKLRQISVLGEIALAQNFLGREKEAFTTLERSLKIAEPLQYTYPFIIKLNPMKELLQKVKSKGVSPVFVDSTLHAFPKLRRTAPGKSFNNQLPEPLTDREIDILRLLDSSKSSNEIADELVVAVSTIRTHIKNIYRKLEVNHRIDAIQKATKLGIIQKS